MVLSSRARHDRIISMMKELDVGITQIVDKLENAYCSDSGLCLSKEECELLALISRFGIYTYMLSESEALLMEDQTDIFSQ